MRLSPIGLLLGCSPLSKPKYLQLSVRTYHYKYFAKIHCAFLEMKCGGGSLGEYRTDKQNELLYMQITVFLDVTPCNLVEFTDFWRDFVSTSSKQNLYDYSDSTVLQKSHMHITVFLDVTFGSIYRLHNQDRFYLEDVGRKFLQKSVNSTRLYGVTSSKATYTYIPVLFILKVC